MAPGYWESLAWVLRHSLWWGEGVGEGGEGEWGEVEDSIRTLVTGPNPSGVDVCCFIAA